MNYEDNEHDIEALDDEDESAYEEVKQYRPQEPAIFDPLRDPSLAKRKFPTQKQPEQKEESKSQFVSKRISEMETQSPQNT
jgi:hypothetical protein